MADPRFYKVEGPFDIEQLAQISDAKIGGKTKKGFQYLDLEPLSTATKCDVSFIDNPKYISEFLITQAGAILVSSKLIKQAPSNAALLITENPYLGYAKLTQAFYPPASRLDGFVDSFARVHSSAEIGANVIIESGAVISKNSSVGDETIVGANSYIGPGVDIGCNCNIGTNVTLTHCIIGKENIIHTGVRIGQDGFGFSPGKRAHTKVNQLGRVIIGDRIEIGANTTIDRGSGSDTKIGDGTKIDNLVHIAHNVQIGQGCFITAQNGFAGSAKIGNFVSFGGQSAVNGHVTVGDGAQISGTSGVTKNIEAGVIVAGNPAQNSRDHWKGLARLKRLVREKRN
jgi:UDP-3-O-[3-hydroxymyristoyl] glucosamine N-acyltransferase